MEKQFANTKCPECKEKYLYYRTKKNKIKGIGMQKCTYQFLFSRYKADLYHCNTCGYMWKESIVKI